MTATTDSAPNSTTVKQQSPVQEALLGSLFGVNGTLFIIAFFSFMFPGGLAPYLGLGLMLGLIGNGIMNLVGGIASTVPAVIVSSRDKAGVILGGIGFGFGTIILDDPSRAPALATNFIVIIGCAAILTGLVMYLAGRFGLGRIAQILPYPVIGGFMAGSGVLMFKAGFTVMLDQRLHLETMPLIFHNAAVPHWGLALVAALCLSALLRRFPTPYTLPIVMIVVTGIVYTGYFLFPTIVTDDWFFKSMPPVLEQFRTLSPTAIDPGLIIEFAPEFGTIALLTLLASILSIISVGITFRRDISLDDELQANGKANMAAGLAGAMAGHTSNSDSNMIHAVGGRTRIVGIASGLVCIIIAVIAPGLTDLVPRVLPAIILFLFALNYLQEWIFVRPKTWPLADKIVTLAIIFLVIMTGLLTAIGGGLIIATLMFAIRYSRIPVRKSERKLSDVMTRTEWPPQHRARLVEEGANRLVIALHGFLFFGSIMRLVDRMRDYPENINHVHFDFEEVTGADSSATLAMSRLALIAENKGIALSQSAIPGDIKAFATIEGATVYATLEEATHEFEMGELAGALAPAIPLSDGLTSQGIPQILHAQFKPLSLCINDTLFEQGDKSGDIYYLESGELSVVAPDGTILRTLQPGVLVGEMARYADFTRTATVKARLASTLYRLSDDDINALPEDQRAALHESIARLLTSRLAAMTRIMSQS